MEVQRTRPVLAVGGEGERGRRRRVRGRWTRRDMTMDYGHEDAIFLASYGISLSQWIDLEFIFQFILMFTFLESTADPEDNFGATVWGTCEKFKPQRELTIILLNMKISLIAAP